MNYRGDDFLLAGYRFYESGIKRPVKTKVLDQHASVLPDAVDAVLCLGKLARYPRKFREHRYACGGEREPHARRLKISNEHPHIRVVLESLHGLVPGLHRGVPGDRNRLDPDQFQNPRDDFLVVSKHHDFGFLLQDVLDVRDRRANLGQPEESTRLCQIAHARRFDPVLHEDCRVFVLDLHSVPDLPICRQEDRLPNLLRQLGQHVPLETAEHVGLQSFREFRCVGRSVDVPPPVAVPVGAAVADGEIAESRPLPRVDAPQERPNFFRPVQNRRAGQEPFPFRGDGEHHLGTLGFTVLDVVGLVRNQGRPGVAQRYGVPVEDVVVDDHDARTRPGGSFGHPYRGPGGQPGCQLVTPVQFEGCRADDQRPSDIQKVHRRDGLYRLACALLVSQDGSTAGGKELSAGLLVGP